MNFGGESEGGGEEWEENEPKMNSVMHVTGVQTPLTVNDSGQSQCLAMQLEYGKFKKINNVHAIVDIKFQAK